MTTVSIILYICGDEDVDTVLATAKSMALCDVYEAAAVCADNCDVYWEELEKLGIAFLTQVAGIILRYHSLRMRQYRIHREIT